MLLSLSLETYKLASSQINTLDKITSGSLVINLALDFTQPSHREHIRGLNIWNTFDTFGNYEKEAEARGLEFWDFLQDKYR